MKPDTAELLGRLKALKAQVEADDLHEDLALEDALHDQHPWRVIDTLLDELERECWWKKIEISEWCETPEWVTACGEDYCINEEWQEQPTPFCPNCGGKVRVEGKGK